jgi:hypothetical protein
MEVDESETQHIPLCFTPVVLSKLLQKAQHQLLSKIGGERYDKDTKISDEKRKKGLSDYENVRKRLLVCLSHMSFITFSSFSPLLFDLKLRP